MATAFRRHLADAEAWLAEQPNVTVLYVPYKAVIDQAAAEIERVNAFFRGALDIAAMADVIDQKLAPTTAELKHESTFVIRGQFHST